MLYCRSPGVCLSPIGSASDESRSSSPPPGEDDFPVPGYSHDIPGSPKLSIPKDLANSTILSGSTGSSKLPGSSNLPGSPKSSSNSDSPGSSPIPGSPDQQLISRSRLKLSFSKTRQKQTASIEADPLIVSNPIIEGNSSSQQLSRLYGSSSPNSSGGSSPIPPSPQPVSPTMKRRQGNSRNTLIQTSTEFNKSQEGRNLRSRLKKTNREKNN